jgi:hypothetical protein
MILEAVFVRILSFVSKTGNGGRALVMLTVLTMSLSSGCSGGGTISQSGAPSQSVVSASTQPPSGSTPPSGSSAGSFATTGSMTVARANHTATLLPNEKVLIAGGVGVGLQPLASAELYDPSTGGFTPTGRMNISRAHATAVLLRSGKVLIAGGDQQASAELYDPSTGVFTPTGNLIPSGVSKSLLQAPAVLLPDGRVLVEGLNAEIYDSITGTFALTVAYPDANPSWSTASLLLDGRVLLTGCIASCSAGATELFDPKTTTFSTTGPMKGWLNVNTATVLMSGKVLFVGNAENDGSPGDAEVYDPAGGAFSTIGKTMAPHEFSAAVRLADGRVLIAGGQLPGGSGSPGVDLYLSATGTFVSAPNMTTGCHEQTATLLPDGTVLIVGGYSTWPVPTSSAEIYKPTAP